MGKTSAAQIEEARLTIAKVMTRVGVLMNAALQDVTEDEAKAGMRLPQGEAPMWAHTIAKAYVAQVRIDATQAPAVQQSLSVTIVQRAGSNEEWLKMAEPYRKSLPELPEKLPAVVDVEPVEAKK